MKKILLLAFLALGMAFFAACDDDDNDNGGGNTQTQESEPANVAEGFTVTELTVRGMTCQRCVTLINKEVSALSGVASVSTDLDSGKVTIEHETGLDIDTVKNIIILEGFEII